MDQFNADTDTYRSVTINSLLSLAGKTVVVTGGCRGLGLSIAVGCAELGGTVVIADILDQPKEDLSRLKTENNITLHYRHVDVASYDGLQSTFAEIADTFGCIQCLVNAAGVGTGGPFLECGKAVIDKILDVNVKGTILATQLAIEQMMDKDVEGAIVNISSIGGHAGIPGQQNAAYCASKGAILGFTKSLAVEFAQRRIRVNSVSPGFFLTKVTPGYVERDVARLKLFESLVPMGRFADRAEIKSIVAFLLSPASSYITGEDIVIDGGVLA